MKAPAFQFYPKDFLADTALMSAEQAGAYWRLCCYAWTVLPGMERGHLPIGERALAKLAGVSLRRWRVIAPEILNCFRLTDSNTYMHKRLLAEVEKQKGLRSKRSDAARFRWNANALQTGCKSDALQSAICSLQTAQQGAAPAAPLARLDIGKPAPKRKPPEALPELPPSIDTPEVRAAWEDFVAERRSWGKAMSPRAAELIQRDLVKFGPAGAEAALRQSIRSRWTDVYPPKNNGRAAQPAAVERSKGGDAERVAALRRRQEAARFDPNAKRGAP